MPPGTRVGESGAVVDVRASASDAVVLLRWGRDPNVYGIPIPLGAVDKFFGWPDEGIEQRLADLDITLMEELDTGLMHRARRRLVGDYIELTGPDWPYDQRFYPSVAYPGHGDPRALAATMRAAGLDPALALARAEAGTLVAWVVAHENNRQGMPYLGQAVVTGLDEKHAELELLELPRSTSLTRCPWTWLIWRATLPVRQDSGTCAPGWTCRFCGSRATGTRATAPGRSTPGSWTRTSRQRPRCSPSH